MRIGFFVGALVACGAVGCGSDSPATTGGEGGAGAGGGATTSTTSTHGDTTSTSSSGGSGGAGGGETHGLKVRGSVEQVDVWYGEKNTKIELRDGSGAIVQTGTTDHLGSLVLRKVPAADDYEVREPDADPPVSVKPVKVMTIPGSLPDPSFYSNQTLKPGYGYITTRDGTKLAAYVTLPGPEADGPYPTMVNYSGYNPAEPGKPIDGFSALCPTYPVLCDAPSDPSAMLASLMGYATVSVNMRGTGCSGGAYDYFEDLQLLDGYDVIEAVAAQSFVKGHKVGMTGLSYPGITQLFVARTHPPHLAAITPLSVIGGTYSTARPGGIFNDGFALSWVTSVLNEAAPYGQHWEQGLVDAGDKVCEENQLLHAQKVDVIAEAENTPYYTDELVGRVDPTTFVNEIDVPVFLASGFQDEQTGPFFYTLLDQFKSSPVTRFNIYNGVHVDGFAPQILVEWKTFLDLYVAEVVPKISDSVRAIGPQVSNFIFNQNIPLPPDRFANYATWEEAKAAYEAEMPVRVIFEDGASDPLGGPVGTFEQRFASWPAGPTTPTRFWFQPDGSLGDAMPAVADAGATFTLDPDAGHRSILASGSVWDALPNYDWEPPAAGAAVVMETPKLTEDVVMLGTASVDLWIRAAVDDADLEVNLMEIRPDGQEMYVQSGWLRASERSLAADATDLDPRHTYKQEEEKLLVSGEWTAARVGFPAFSHVFRKDSRIRVMVDTPGDSRAVWAFALKTYPDGTTYDIGASANHPSSVLFPVLTGVAATTPMPPCPSLRGQPCRTYAAYTNVATIDP